MCVGVCVCVGKETKLACAGHSVTLASYAVGSTHPLGIIYTLCDSNLVNFCDLRLWCVLFLLIIHNICIFIL